jgi:primosomal protein N'
VPEHLAGATVGSLVRVPLAGRRVRGWVVETTTRPRDGLKEIASISGSLPVFDSGLAASLHWAAGHYVAPYPVVLAKATPPNLPREARPDRRPSLTMAGGGGPVDQVATDTAAGKRRPITAVVGRWRDLEWIRALAAPMSEGGSVVVVAATVAEVGELAERASPHYGDRLIALTTDDAAQVTRSWERAQSGGCLLIGTPRVAAWHVRGLALVLVLEEGRRAMKERQTPTIHVRDLTTVRSRVEGFNAVFFGPTPSVELMAAGASMLRSSGRPWALVEVVDRSGEGPGGRLLSDQSMAAIRAVTAVPGETGFVLTGRSLAIRVTEEINHRLGGKASSTERGEAPILVGTERDLAGLEPVTLAVVTSVDAMMRGGGYRSSEETLRQLARLGGIVRGGRGHRMIVQTDDPGSSLIATLRRGEPIPFLEGILVERAREGFPPASEMIAIELRGRVPEGVASEIEGLGAREVLGPMIIDEGKRWLISGDLALSRRRLRSIVGTWREKGATVRIDADPIDM